MVRHLLVLALCGAAIAARSAAAQHSDIEFFYGAGQIELAPTEQTPSSEQGVWTGEWDVDGFFKQVTNNPGFASEAAAGLGINADDIIAYDVLDDLLFWNGAQFATPSGGVHVRIENTVGNETIISASSGEQPGSVSVPYVNAVGQADGQGDFHSHVDDFILEPLDGPQPDLGAYGMKMRLRTSAVGIGESDPFMLVFNFGLDEPGFNQAIDAFAALLAPGLPGDFNSDGFVDSIDYAVWREGLGGEFTPGDFDDWIANYGRSAASPASDASVAPEPASLCCLIAFAIGWRSVRKERL